MTGHTTRRETRTENRTMATVSHTNPHTGESMGQVFEHGVTVVADGGRDPAREEERRGEPFDAEPEEDDASESSDTTDENESADATDASESSDATDENGSSDDRDVMADVRHRTTDDAAANRVFERGGEHGERDED